MTDETVTGWRTRLLRAWAWCLENPVPAAAGVAFVCGIILGAVLL